MSTAGAVVTVPVVVAAPGFLRSTLQSLIAPLLVAVLLIGYYELRLKPPPPTPPALVIAVVDYRNGLADLYSSAEKGVRSGSLSDSTSILAVFSAHGKPVGDAMSVLVSANCDPATGKVTNTTALADAFGQVKTALGGK